MAFSDSFTGTAGQLLSARPGWTFVAGSGTDCCQINAANQLKKTANTLTNGSAAFYATGDNGLTTQTVAADIKSASFTSGHLVVLGSVVAGVFVGYAFTPQVGASSGRLHRVTNNGGVSLKTNIASFPLNNTGDALEVDVQIVAGNPSFTVKQGGTQVGTFTDSTAGKIVTGQRGLWYNATSGADPSIDNYADNYAAATSVALTLAEPLGGFVYEGARQASAISIPVSWTGVPTSISARVVDGVGNALGGFDWTPKLLAPAPNSNGILAFAGVPVGGPYRVQVRDVASGAEADGISDFFVGAVVILHGRSQADKLATLGVADDLPPTAASNVSYLKLSGSKALYTMTQVGGITRFSGGNGGLSSGIVAWANQWQADTANMPLMVVEGSWSGMGLTSFLNDYAVADYCTIGGITGTFNLGDAVTQAGSGAAGSIVAINGSIYTIQLTNPGPPEFTNGAITDTTTGGTGTVSLVTNYKLWSNFETDIANVAGRQCSAVLYYWQDNGVVGYGASLAAVAAKFNTLLTGQIPLHSIVPGLRANNVQTQLYRQELFTQANAGGAFRLAAYVSDIVMSADASPHQIAGATGNTRVGFKLGRSCAWLFNAALQHLGPQVVSCGFTSAGRTIIEITFDQPIHTPDSSVSGIQGVYVSTDSGATFPNPPAGYTVAISAANKIRITKTAGSWAANVTRVDFLRDVPFGSDIALPDYVGPESTLAANFLDKTIYDTGGFEGGRGMHVSPVMGTGAQVADFSVPGIGSGSGRISLGISLGL